MKTVIVLFGCAGMGKSTAARMFQSLLGGEIMNFADPVKEVGRALFGIPLAIGYGTQEMKESFIAHGRTARQAYQWIGTEVGRDGVCSTVWVDRMVDRITDSTSQLVIIGDGRFPVEEYHHLKAVLSQRSVGTVLGFKIVRAMVEINRAHRSESVIADWDASLLDGQIENHGNLDTLRMDLEMLIERFGLRPCERTEYGRMYTYTGRPFWPFDPRASDVCLEDIAHHLSLENRWGGGTRIGVNVAHHSNNVRKLAMFYAPAELKLQAGLYAQLHDAHEAYLKDIPKPLEPFFPGLATAKDRLDAAIFEQVGMVPPSDDVRGIVHQCDKWMAGIEASWWRHHQTPPLPVPPQGMLYGVVSSLNKTPDPVKDEAEFLGETRVLLNLIRNKLYV